MKTAKPIVKKAAKASIDALMIANGSTARAFAGALQGDSLPYVKLGPGTETDAGDKTSDCSEVLIPYTVWSFNQDEAETLAGLIQEELTGSTKLTLDAPFTIISQELDVNPPTETDRLQQNTIYGASVQVRFLVEH